MIFRDILKQMQALREEQAILRNELSDMREKLEGGFAALSDIISTIELENSPFKLDDKRMQDGISNIMGFFPGEKRK